MRELGAVVCFPGRQDSVLLGKPNARMIRIQKARGEDSKHLAGLANTIWREHYIPIIGKPQVDYMLTHFQSEKAIASQIQEGVHYFLLLWKDQPVGYYAFQPRDSECFLSKIYVLKEYRGMGLGRAAMEDLRFRAEKMDCNRITLTVNKDNKASIAAYKRLGFQLGPPSVKDIGGGFYMDDYLMALEL